MHTPQAHNLSHLQQPQQPQNLQPQPRQSLHTLLRKTTAVLLTLSSAAFSLGAHAADTKVRTTSYEYTALGQLAATTLEPTAPNDCLKTSYGYDTRGNLQTTTQAACAGASGDTLISATVARTQTDKYSDNYGTDSPQPLTSTNALGQSETKTYDERFGALTSLKGPNGLTTTWTYDNFGRKTKETRADNTTTTWAYKLCTDTGANCPVSVGGAAVVWFVIEQSYAVNAVVNAPEKRQYYDTLDRVVRTQTQGYDGAGVAAPTVVQDTEYNALGQIKRQSNSYALVGEAPVWSNYTYDALGRIKTESHPENSGASVVTATTTTDYSGLTVVVTNANNKKKTTTKNAQGQIASVTDDQGNTITYTYDALGNLTQTNAAGSITKLQYNQRGQKIAMQDPAMGSWTYSYNAYGELVKQTDSLGQVTTIAYDLLGRMTQRTESDLVSTWSYDKKFDNTPCGKGIGKLCEAKSGNDYKRVHSYDTLGRQESTSTLLDANATVSETFDANTGRVASKTWPTGYKALYSYTPLGYLKTVTGKDTSATPKTVSYTVQKMNAQGQITQYLHGNNVTVVKNFDSQTQRLSSQLATTSGQTNGNVLTQAYQYDALGNLTKRTDNSPSVGTSESFSYDSLNRLSMATLVGGVYTVPTSTQVLYDARGNITYKSDVGRYWYDAARPNRMTNVTLETAPGATIALTGTRTLSYAFDDYKPNAKTIGSTTVGNGNLEYTVSHDTVNNIHTVRYESYTSFNMPKQIVYGNFITNTSSTADRTLSFVYGPEHQRIKQNIKLSTNGTSSYFDGNVWYLNGEDSLGLSYEKEVRTNGTTEHKHYVSVGGQTFAIFTSRTGTLNGLPATSTSYLYHDQLGSISAIADENGAVVERLAYDPWGKRRFINTTPGKPDTRDAIVGIRTDRGFTEHEHLDEVGVIHMNGRIYDPLMGRFMSADPHVTYPDFLQSFNRYAYVLNNPLNMTDPTGFDAWSHEDSNGKTSYNSSAHGHGLGGISPGHSLGGSSGSSYAGHYALRGPSLIKNFPGNFPGWKFKGDVPAPRAACDSCPDEVGDLQRKIRASQSTIALNRTQGEIDDAQKASKEFALDMAPGSGLVSGTEQALTADDFVDFAIGLGMVATELPGFKQLKGLRATAKEVGLGKFAAKGAGDFDAARRTAFEKAGMTDASKVEFSKMDPKTGTVVEFKGQGGAKVGYDGPHASPGPHHDKQHISWQSAGKRDNGGTKRGNEPYSGPQHPSRSDRKEQ